MTRTEEIHAGLEKLRRQKAPWQQRPEQRTDAVVAAWWNALVKRKPQLAAILWAKEQARREEKRLAKRQEDG